MAFFTAALVRDGEVWRDGDVDLDDLADSGDQRGLVRALRDLAPEGEPALLLVEREDEWWALVRVDDDEEVRVFVSDVDGAGASRYAGLLRVPEADADVVLVGPGEEPAPAVEGPRCAGDLEVLADLGTSPGRLRELCDDGTLPMDAIAEVSGAAGFGDVLDALR